MDFFDVVQERYSYRGPYADAPVPREDLLRMVEAGRVAPSGCNAQTTEFVVVDDPATLREISGLISRPESLATAPAAIALVATPNPVFRGRSFHLEDLAAATQNILLAITALGYASVWVQGSLMVPGVTERISELLAIPSGKELLVLLPVGVPVSPGPRPAKKALEDRVFWNQMSR